MSPLPTMYPMFAAWARLKGLESAVEGVTGSIADDDIAAMKAEYERAVAEIEDGFPFVVTARPEEEWWYAGPLPDDIYWPPTRHRLATVKGWPDEPLKLLDKASSKVVAYTHPPQQATYLSKGLVVGYVQSGKTTNFTAVAAKAADVGYRLIIVLSGIHNGLRRQTQDRLWADLVMPAGEHRWYALTQAAVDFHPPTMSAAALLHGEKNTMLCVVKKNATVLRRLIDWLAPAAKSGSLGVCNSLIIDDEADQASVATAKINPLIRELLQLLPRRVYVGYTATPFANVLIDPAADDLYPERFILNLPLPAGYFGPETIFGRNEVAGDDPASTSAELDGYDMVREIPETEALELRPTGNAALAAFQPAVEGAVRDAVLYFLMATAARHVRGQEREHSSMLIHTSVRVAAHAAFRGPLVDFLSDARRRLEVGDQLFTDELAAVWRREAAAVPPRTSDWANAAVAADAVLDRLPAVLQRCRVVLDNCSSEDRIDYTSGEPQIIIAVGGNTLSRGLTLEGLVVSFFVRSASTYDTLMQMGRWFGFRPGYEDLPRIWMTAALENQFRHLATVEHEMRSDIERYEHEGRTPLEVAVRIRTHPSLLVTAKMGAARLAEASYSDTRVQPRYFRVADREWLGANLDAARALVQQAAAASTVSLTDRGIVVLRDLPVHLVLDFIERYRSHENSPSLNAGLLRAYIKAENQHGALRLWNLAVMGTQSGVDGRRVRFSDEIEPGTIVRSRLRDTPDDAADIKTLMSKEDLVVDLDIAQAAAKAKGEASLYRMRNSDPTYSRHGLLLLYPIDEISDPADQRNESRAPLAALEAVIAAAFVFPASAAPVSASYVAVDLSAVKPIDEEVEVEPTEVASLEIDTEEAPVA